MAAWQRVSAVCGIYVKEALMAVYVAGGGGSRQCLNGSVWHLRTRVMWPIL